jgi:hypothetical protein
MSCSGNATSGISPDDPNYQMKLMNNAVTCGRDMEQCTSMCKRHNPTVVELKGIVEVGEIDDPATTPQANGTTHDTKPADAKLVGKKAAISFADEQAAATSELRARLTQQHQQLQILQQRLANIPATTTTATMPARKSTNDCPAATHRKN